MGGELEGQLVSLTSSCLGSTSSIPLELSRGNKRVSAEQVHQGRLVLAHLQTRETNSPSSPLHFLLDCIAYELSVASSVLSGVLSKDFPGPTCLPSLGHFHRR